MVLVELKTDMRSRNDEQDEYLKRAGDMGAQDLVSDVQRIALSLKRPHTKAKYAHLLDLLVDLGLLRRLDATPSARRRAMHTRASDVEVVPTNATVAVVYVQPVADRRHTCIDFAEVADLATERGDVLSLRFAQSLRAWVTPAGD